MLRAPQAPAARVEPQAGRAVASAARGGTRDRSDDFRGGRSARKPPAHSRRQVPAHGWAFLVQPRLCRGVDADRRVPVPPAGELRRPLRRKRMEQVLLRRARTIGRRAHLARDLADRRHRHRRCPRGRAPHSRADPPQASVAQMADPSTGGPLALRPALLQVVDPAPFGNARSADRGRWQARYRASGRSRGRRDPVDHHRHRIHRRAVERRRLDKGAGIRNSRLHGVRQHHLFGPAFGPHVAHGEPARAQRREQGGGRSAISLRADARARFRRAGGPDQRRGRRARAAG